jgi:hypothetical protein
MYALNTICRFSAPGFLNVELFFGFLEGDIETLWFTFLVLRR